MATGDNIKFLLVLGGAGAAIYFLSRQREETPKAYPYPVIGTAGGSVSTAPSSPMTPGTTAPFDPSQRPAPRPHDTSQSPSPIGLPPRDQTPAPAPSQTPPGIPPRPERPRFSSANVGIRPPDQPTVTSARVLGRPVPVKNIIYSNTGLPVGIER